MAENGTEILDRQPIAVSMTGEMPVTIGPDSSARTSIGSPRPIPTLPSGSAAKPQASIADTASASTDTPPTGRALRMAGFFPARPPGSSGTG